MPRLNLLIPMAGQGKRFRKAGYTTFKPFVPIQGKTMIEYVTRAFPPDVRKWVITSRELLNEDQIAFLTDKLQCTIIDIPLHEEGPAFSIQQAASRLPLEEAFFISYCDIFWEWDFKAVRKNLDAEGVIYTHSGFHPHLVQNNYSAFCLPSPENPTRLKEIREKGSFTGDWMNEPVSIGVFYAKSGKKMMEAVNGMIEKNERVSNEFFPSLLFNTFVAQGLEVRLKQLPFYIHWGVPDQLKDFERWRQILLHERNFVPAPRREAPENIVTMAGLGNRMKGVSEKPKALIDVGGKPMFQFVADHFPAGHATFITTPAIAKVLDEKRLEGRQRVLERQTASQWETLLLAADFLKQKKGFFLTSCDAYGIFDAQDFRRFLNDRNPQGVIFTFRPSLLHQKMGSHHTHVSVQGDRVTAVHVKSKSSPEDPGLAGFFWIRDGAIFEALRKMPQTAGTEMIVDHVFEHFVREGLDIARFDLSEYLHLGTPEEFLEFRYWQERSHLFQP